MFRPRIDFSGGLKFTSLKIGSTTSHTVPLFTHNATFHLAFSISIPHSLSNRRCFFLVYDVCEFIFSILFRPFSNVALLQSPTDRLKGIKRAKLAMLKDCSRTKQEPFCSYEKADMSDSSQIHLRWTALPALSFVSALSMQHIDKCQHIFERDISFDGVRRGKDISTGPACCQELSRIVFDILDRAIGQGLLCGQAAVEGKPAFVSFHKVKNVHNLRLKRIEAIEADINQIVKKLIDFAA
jgi:hypothetical protein